MNRCRSNFFRYCNGEPQTTTKQDKVIITGVPSRKEVDEGKVTPEGYRFEVRTISICKLNPETCGKCFIQ